MQCFVKILFVLSYLLLLVYDNYIKKNSIEHQALKLFLL